MANFTPVKPGELISAAFFNQVLGSFDTRISALEASIGASSESHGDHRHLAIRAHPHGRYRDGFLRPELLVFRLK